MGLGMLGGGGTGAEQHAFSLYNCLCQRESSYKTSKYDIALKYFTLVLWIARCTRN